jgi:hypothetical protein
MNYRFYKPYTFLYIFLFMVGIATQNVSAMHGRNAYAIHCNQYGHKDACTANQKLARQFLKILGVPNASTFPIKVLEKISNKKRHNHTNNLITMGLTTSTGIWLNEREFAKLPWGTVICIIAHETIHVSEGHAYHVASHNQTLQQEKDADTKSAKMLCAHGYTWAVKDEVKHLRALVMSGHGNDTDGDHPTIKEQYDYFTKILQNADKYKKQSPEDHILRLADIKDILSDRDNLLAIASIVIIFGGPTIINSIKKLKKQFA